MFGSVSGLEIGFVHAFDEFEPECSALNLGSSYPAKSTCKVRQLHGRDKQPAAGSMWCCCNEETELEVALPKFASEQVLPVAEPVEPVEARAERSLMRAQTAAKLAEMESMHFFTAQFDRSPGTIFGLDVSAVGRVCMVNSVAPDSLVGEWNAKATEEERYQEVIQQQLGGVLVSLEI